MPVDLSIGSGIINAYLAGQRERREAERDAVQKQQTDEALKEHSRQFDLKQKQENEHFDKTYKLESAARALNGLQIKAALQRHIEENGSLLPGMSETIRTNTSPQEDIDSLNAGTYNAPGMRGELRPGMTGPSLTRDVTLPENAGGGSFSALDPISAALRDAQRARILQAPKTDEAIRQHKGIAEVEYPFKKEIEGMKLANAQTIQSQKDIAAMNRAKLLDAGKMRDAKTRAAATIARGNQTGPSKHLDTYLTTEDLTKYGMPEGTKYRDIAGMKPGKILSPTENEKANTLAGMEENIQHITELGDEIGWSGVGQIAGRLGSTLTAMNMGDNKEEDLRESLTQLKSDIGLMRSGKAFTKNEEAIIDQFVPTKTSSAQKIQTSIARLAPIVLAAKKRIYQPESLIKGGSNNSGGKDTTVDDLVNKHLVKK